jgi:hypothetical protein
VEVVPDALLSSSLIRGTFFLPNFVALSAPDLHVIEQGHEPKIHVQLLVTVKQRKSGMIRHEVYRDLLVTSEHDHVFHHAGRWNAGNVGQLEAVPVQMNRMEVITLIAHVDTIAPPFLHVK